MKNGQMILGGMAVLLLAFGLVFIACDANDDVINLDGKWQVVSSSAAIEIADNNLTQTPGDVKYTFVQTHSTFTLKAVSGGAIQAAQTYQYSDGKLTFGKGGTLPEGPYVKQ